jgi:hypothetical protein
MAGVEDSLISAGLEPPPDPSRGEVFPEIIYLNHAVGEFQNTRK